VSYFIYENWRTTGRASTAACVATAIMGEAVSQQIRVPRQMARPLRGAGISTPSGDKPGSRRHLRLRLLSALGISGSLNRALPGRTRSRSRPQELDLRYAPIPPRPI
jgi:hypothetical protein